MRKNALAVIVAVVAPALAVPLTVLAANGQGGGLAEIQS